MSIEGMEGDYEPEEPQEGPYSLYRHDGETIETFMVRVVLALQDCASKLEGARRRTEMAELKLSAVNFTMEENIRKKISWAVFEAASKASPFIRQHNAISKLVAELLAGKPGPQRALVRFLAETLDMELPETWRVSQD